MKKSILLLLVLVTSSVIAQQNKPEPGTYVSNAKTGENIKLVIDNDNKFHIAVLTGFVEQENDSIYFRSEFQNQPLFQTEYVKSAAKTKTIKVIFDKANSYSFYGVYLGTQKINETQIEYKKVNEFLNIDESDFGMQDATEELSAEIEKVAFIYLVKENYRKSSTIEKYEVPDGVTEIKIGVRNDLFGKLNLRGTYNPTSKEMTISEGKTPLTFVKAKEKPEENKYVKPIESQEKKYWTYPGKEKDNLLDFEADSTSVEYDDYSETPKYVFRLKIEKTLNEALKVAQSSPDKLLVVFYDNGKNAQKEFEKYIQRYENAVEMYDQYNPEEDKFNFYLAKEADKNALKKSGITEDKSIAFFNSDGVKIYHCKGEMKGFKFNYYNLSNLNDELQLVNNKAKLDKVITDKKATVPQIEKVLLNIRTNKRNVYDYSAAAVALPEKYMQEDEYDAIVDTMAVEVVEEEGYELPEKQNAYQFKSTQDAVNARYKQVLDFYQKSKTLNLDLVKIIVSELSSNGFTSALFEKNNQAAKPTDFQSMDYLFQFYNEIDSLKVGDAEIEDDYYYFENPQLVVNTVSEFLNQPSNVDQKDKVKEYYNKLLLASNQNPKVYRNLISYHKDSKNKSELISTYEHYFGMHTQSNTNLIEALDANYQLEQGSNWDAYKMEFASLANDSAWFIVENSQDKTEIQKAIKWSETSLKLEPGSNYYLDTLAQLYYKNGEKEKGIQFEQKAIDAAKTSLDLEQVEIYQAVLDKMKNGTY